MIRSQIIGYGAYLPAREVTNADLEKTLDTTDAWIVERTGIRTRHIAAEGELTSHLAARASEAAIMHSGIDRSDIDCVLVATTTPDLTLPATATRVQQQLGLARGFAYDLAAACSGFVYALATADAYIKTGMVKTALVIGAETFSRIVDWKDRATCILFGDGAGAVLLQAAEGSGTPKDRGILASVLYSDGRFGPILASTGGVGATGSAGIVTMAGKEVFRHAVGKMAESLEASLALAGVAAHEIDWIVPHQANQRILDATAERLGLPPEKLIVTVGKHANTSAASIPLALADAAARGLLAEGDLVAMPALGAGLTWGSTIVRW